MASILPNGKTQFIDQNGKPLAYGTVTFYAPGTTTKKDTWQDSAMTQPNTNPIVLDSRGQATIWGLGSYRQIVKDWKGALIWDQLVSEYSADIEQLKTDLADSGGAALIGFVQGGTDAIARTLQDKARERVSTFDFMTAAQIADVTSGAPALDHTSALLSAMQYAQSVNSVLEWEEGQYVASDFLLTFSTNQVVRWSAKGKVRVKSNKVTPRTTGGSLDSSYPGLGIAYDSDYFVRFQPAIIGTSTLSVDAQQGDTWINVTDISQFVLGAPVKISSTRLIQTDHRGSAIEGQLSIVDEVDVANSRIRIRDPLEYTAPKNTVVNGTISAVNADNQLTLSGINLPDRSARVQCQFPTRGGFSYISMWNNATGVAMFNGMFKYPFPAGLSAGDPVSLVWKTTITVYAPYEASIEGDFTFERQLHTGATAGDIGFRALDIHYAARSRIDDLKVLNFSECGIRVRGCYRPVVNRAQVYGANRGYNGADGTGYGVSVEGCYASVISKPATSNCRKGVDVIGFDTISWHDVIDEAHSTGGGVMYNGEVAFPVGTFATLGVGSHGSAYYTKYIAPTLRDQRHGIGCRGYRERVVNPNFVGASVAPFRIYAGGTGTRIEGGSYEDGITDVNFPAGSEYQTTTRPNTRARMLAYVEMQADFPNIDLSINGFRAHSLSQCIIGLDTQNTPRAFNGVFTLEMGNVVTYASAVGASPAVSLFRGLELDPSLASVRLVYHETGENPIIDDGSYTGTVEKIGLRSTWDLQPGDYLYLGNDLHQTCIADQSVFKFRVSQNAKMCQLSIWDFDLDRPYRAENMKLGAGRNVDYAAIQASNKVGVTIQNAILTGTTGPSGSLNITFRANGDGTNWLYLENRTGALIRPKFHLLIDK